MRPGHATEMADPPGGATAVIAMRADGFPRALSYKDSAFVSTDFSQVDGHSAASALSGSVRFHFQDRDERYEAAIICGG